MVLPLAVMQEESIQLIDEATSKNRIIGLAVATNRTDKTPYPKEDLAKIGTSALILKMAKTEDRKAQLLVQGLSRFRVTAYQNGQPYLMAKVEHLTDRDTKDNETEALMSNNLVGLFIKIVELSPGLPEEMGGMAKSIQESGTLADMVASTINSSTEEKLKVLETTDVKERLKEVTRLANHQLDTWYP